MDVSINWQRVSWVALGVLISLAVASALYAYLGSLVVAIFAYYAARPVYRRVNRRLDNDAAVAWLTIAAFVIPLLALITYAAVVFVAELRQFLTSGGLGAIDSFLRPLLPFEDPQGLRAVLDRILEDPQRLFQGETISALTTAIGPVQTVVGLLFSVGGRLFLISIFVYYFLKDGNAIAEWFRRTVGYDAAALSFAERVDRDLEQIFFGNLATIVATSLIAVVTFFALDLLSPGSIGIFRPILLGILVGVGTLVPVVGMKIVYVPVTAYLVGEALVWGSAPVWFPVAFFVVTFVVVDAVPDFIVRSFLSSGNIRMGLVIFGYVIGTMAWGWVGLFLGPIVLVLFVRFAQDVLPRLIRHREVR